MSFNEKSFRILGMIIFSFGISGLILELLLYQKSFIASLSDYSSWLTIAGLGFAFMQYVEAEVRNKLQDKIAIYERQKQEVYRTPLHNIIDVKEAARILGINTELVKHKCQNNEIKAKKLNNNWIIDKSQLDM